MSDTTLKPLKTFSLKCEEETVDRFKHLKEELGFATDGQLMTALVDRFEQPQKVADRSRELEAERDSLKAALDEVKLDRDALVRTNEELRQQLDAADARANSNAEAANLKQLEYEKQLADLQPKDNQAVISFTLDNLRVLDIVCARESKRRGQQWSRSHVVNYFINARFVRGLLNGDLESVSDSELRKAGISLKRPGKEDFEL